MPSRCKTCKKICDTPDAPTDCPSQGHTCDFETITLLHYVSPQGAYKQIGKGARIGTGKEGAEEVTDHPLKLHCMTTVTVPRCTNVRSAVTCPKCLQTLPPTKQEKLEE